jgi:hypothetical protein
VIGPATLEEGPVLIQLHHGLLIKTTWLKFRRQAGKKTKLLSTKNHLSGRLNLFIQAQG